MRRGGQPSGEVGFEGGLIIVAGTLGFASDFLHDVSAILFWEEDGRSLKNVLGTLAPGRVAVGVIVHICSAHKHGAGVVRPLNFGRHGTVSRHLGAVVDVVVFIHEHRIGHPVPSLLGPFGVRSVVGIPRQARCELEESTVGYTVFVVVTIVGQVDLPSQTSATFGCIPAGGLLIENGLSEAEPRGLLRRWIRIIQLSGGQGGESPECLIIVTLSTLGCFPNHSYASWVENVPLSSSGLEA